MDRSVEKQQNRGEESVFSAAYFDCTWRTQHWLKWWLGKVRIVYIDGCFDEYCGKVRAGLQSNFLSPKRQPIRAKCIIFALNVSCRFSGLNDEYYPITQ